MKTIEQIKEKALNEHIPIIMDDTLEVVGKILEDKKPERILEIGTAVGYSAIMFSKYLTENGYIDTIERDEERYKIAVENINKSNYKNQINIILSDALDVNLTEKYDLIFIDAAKGKNKEFIDKFKKNLKTNGFIIIDNMDFHGLVGKSSEIKKRRLRSLIRKIESFIEYMEDQTEFKVSKINVGDGLYLLERNN